MRCFIASRLVLVIILIHLKIIKSVVDNIKIGAIFHEGDEHLEAAFDEALRDLDNKPATFFTVKPVKKVRVEREGFATAITVCELLQEGVAAIIGPTHHETRKIVSSIAERFNVPHIEYSYQRRDERISEKSINVYPSNQFYNRLIAEVVKNMRWNSFTFVYQTRDALTRIQEVLQDRGPNVHALTFEELKPLSEIKLLKTERERVAVYESLVKKIKDSGQYSLLIDVEIENLPKLLYTMRDMGLMSDYFMGLIVNLDGSTVDMRQYINKDSVANITWFKFLQGYANNMPVEASLLYDSVYALDETLNNLYKEINSNSSMKIRPLPLACDGEAKYEMGLNLTKMFVKKVKSGVRSGLMTFKGAQTREFELEIYNTLAGETRLVGKWKKDALTMIDVSKLSVDALTEKTRTKVFRVVTRVGAPYVKEVEDNTRPGRYIEGKKYEGYCIDLIEMIERTANIKCEFQFAPDKKYGNWDPKTKQWNGLIKQLLDFKADMAICDLTITAERQSVVDFTAPFMNLGITILFSRPAIVAPKMWTFLDPLSPEVWMCMALTYLIVSVMILVQARVAPGEWVSPHPCNTETEEMENQFTLVNSLWLTMGTLMQQGSDILPRSVSVRLLAGFWFFFILIVQSSYTANLAAFLTAVKMGDDIDSIEDLAKTNRISYGSMEGGSTYQFFKNSNNSLYQRIFMAMDEKRSSVFVKDNDEGVERVRKGGGKYAFFMESTSIEYQTARHCDLKKVGPLLDNKGYGIATPPNSPFRTMISTAILRLQEKTELQTLKQKWWETNNTCEGYDEPENSNELTLPHVGGVFLVLIIGCVAAVLVAFSEFVWNTRRVAIEERITPWEALVEEFKFFVNFTLTTKPVRKNNSNSASNSTSIRRNGTDRSDSINSAPSLLHTMAIHDGPHKY